MSEEFFDSVCRKTLLDIVARGSAILAEMQRLSNHIPKMFKDPGTRYSNVIICYKYFSDPNKFEDDFQRDDDLVELNQNLKKTYLPLLQKFYRLFDSIITYYESLHSFIEEIQTGVFMQFSLEDILQVIEGKQLISQAFYLFGVMLLLMDRIIPGIVRERILVFYYRNRGGQNINRINEVKRLCINRGYSVEQQENLELERPEFYPEELFEPFPLNTEILDSIIIAIKDDDIYKQMPAYPQAKLRSFALSNQASMIWVLLFMRVDILHKAKSTMREIVDKHFYNCWVIPFYLGYVIDLTYWWKPYRAAKLALQNILDIESITELSNQFSLKLNQCSIRCKQYLTEGVLTDEYVLYRLTNLMNVLRQSNITLRWLMLHRKTNHAKLKQIVNDVSNPIDILKLLLICAEYEIILKERLQSLLNKKQNIWEQDRNVCSERMKQLSAYFGGEQSLGKIQSDQSFKQWFSEIGNVIQSINYSNSTYASQKIKQLIISLEDIEQYHQISSSIQIKQYLHDTRKDLDHMIKLANIKKSHLTSIEVISDITWCWLVLQDYIKYIQKEIRKDPDIALLLKNTFMKFSSILNTPMVRIIQADSPDVEPVSHYYSQELVKIVKKVLQVIPRLVFQILGNIITIFTERIKNQPLKFDKAELANLAQFQQRLEIAKYNHEISVFAKSILDMQSYLLGVVEVNPRQILEKGIRKQLIRLLAHIIEDSLVKPTITIDLFKNKIIGLAKKLDSFKLSIEYLQDFVHIYGLKMFFEEFQKLIYSYVDMEKTALLNQDASFDQLNYDEDVPFPALKDPEVTTFLGWTLREILQITNPKRATFILTSYGFYSIENKSEVFSLKILNILHQCIGISGLQGIDYLLSLKITRSLNKLIKFIRTTCEDDNVKHNLNKCYESLRHVSSFSDRYEHTINSLKKLFKNQSLPATKEIMKIGHYMILRDMICLELRMLSKIGTPRLYLCLENLNNTMLNDLIKNQVSEAGSEEKLNNQNLLLALVNPYFKHLGMLQPLKKIFITSEPIHHLSLFLFTLITVNITQIDYDKKIKSLVRAKKDIFDPNSFVTGILCVLQQFHPSNKDILFAFLSSYIRSTINFIVVNKEIQKHPQLISDLFTYLRLFEEFIKYSREPYQKYKAILDLGLFSSLDKETIKPSKN